MENARLQNSENAWKRDGWKPNQTKPMLIPNECLNFYSRRFSTKNPRIDFHSIDVPFHLLCRVYGWHTHRHQSMISKSMTSWGVTLRMLVTQTHRILCYIICPVLPLQPCQSTVFIHARIKCNMKSTWIPYARTPTHMQCTQTQAHIAFQSIRIGINTACVCACQTGKHIHARCRKR